MDLLQEHLTRARASGGAFARSVACPPWGLRLSGDIQLAVHAVVKGQAELWLDDASESLTLRAGDVALVRGGPDHHIGAAAGASCLPLAEFRAAHADTDVNDPEATVFLCGAYRLAGEVGRALLHPLPGVLSLSAAVGEPVWEVVELLSGELSEERPGHQTVLDRLLDVVLVLAIRSVFEQAGPEVPRWYRAATDARLGPVLLALHADPAHAWTVAELAAASGCSRATLARNFTLALGQPPMSYLTELRMSLAREYLRDGEVTITEIAQRVGYASPYAFAAAFRRHHHQPPGRWRSASGNDEGSPV